MNADTFLEIESSIDRITKRDVDTIRRQRCFNRPISLEQVDILFEYIDQFADSAEDTISETATEEAWRDGYDNGYQEGLDQAEINLDESNLQSLYFESKGSVFYLTTLLMKRLAEHLVVALQSPTRDHSERIELLHGMIDDVMRGSDKDREEEIKDDENWEILGFFDNDESERIIRDSIEELQFDQVEHEYHRMMGH